MSASLYLCMPGMYTVKNGQLQGESLNLLSSILTILLTWPNMDSRLRLRDSASGCGNAVARTQRICLVHGTSATKRHPAEAFAKESR